MKNIITVAEFKKCEDRVITKLQEEKNSLESLKSQFNLLVSDLQNLDVETDLEIITTITKKLKDTVYYINNTKDSIEWHKKDLENLENYKERSIIVETEEEKQELKEIERIKDLKTLTQPLQDLAEELAKKNIKASQNMYIKEELVAGDFSISHDSISYIIRRRVNGRSIVKIAKKISTVLKLF